MRTLIIIFVLIAAGAGAGNAECTALLNSIVHFAHDAIAAIKQAIQG